MLYFVRHCEDIVGKHRYHDATFVTNDLLHLEVHCPAFRLVDLSAGIDQQLVETLVGPERVIP